MKRKVIIIGYGFSVRLCLARILGELGYEVSLIILERVKSKPIDCYSKYVKNYYYIQGDDEEVLMKVLLEKCRDDRQKVILIPINDFSASVLDKNLNQLEQHFVFQNIRHQQGAVVQWMNKEKQKHLARQIGMDVANSVNIEIANGSYSVPADISYPCFTKTREFIVGYKFTLHRCDNERELRAVLDDLAGRFDNLTLMIEDYKDIDKEYSVVGYSDGKNVVIPAVIEILTMAKGSNRGIALRGKIMPCTGFENLILSFQQIVREVGFAGMFDIDFYLCEGKMYFGELNLRIGGSGFAIIYQGVNLPEMHVRSLLGESIEGMKKEITDTFTYSNERIAIENWFEGHLSNREYFSLVNSADVNAIRRKNDNYPELIFWLKSLKKVFIHKKRSL